MKITTNLQIYEIDGQEIRIEPESNQLIVRSHWNRSGLVELDLGTGHKYTVDADELVRAIEASRKAHRR